MPQIESLEKRITKLEKMVSDLMKGKTSKKPKKPRKPSAFNNFMKKEIPKVKQQNPNLKHADAFKKAAAKWGNLSDAEKKKYSA